MAYGLGSARANKWAMAFYAGIAVVWSGWRVWDYRSSDYVLEIGTVAGQSTRGTLRRAVATGQLD